MKQFKLFHCVLHIDATADSNNEGRPLVTVTAKDSNGRMFTVLRAFLPNEQAWSFKWLFQVVFTSLLGVEYLNDVKIMLGDGCPQQISQIEDAIDKYYSHVYRTRCSWHIIDRGWYAKVNIEMGGKSRRKRRLGLKGARRNPAKELTERNKVARKLYRWMFSWAQAGHCETLEEFQVSKALYLKFLKSKEVTTLLGTGCVDTLVGFLRQHVSPHEDRFCYYRRRGLFHLESHSNTSHEGTNNALFNCAAPVMPTNSVEKAAKTLYLNADVKTRNTCIKMCEKNSSRKLWSSSPTSDFVTDLCESLLMTEWSKADDYISYRSRCDQWFVCHVNEKKDRVIAASNDSATELESDDGDTDWWEGGFDEENETLEEDKMTETEKKIQKFGVIPKFRRVYEVRINEMNCLSCSCLKHSRMGYPCRHIGSVMKNDASFKLCYAAGFPLTSVIVFWRQEYYLYGMSSNPLYFPIQKTLWSLSRNDTTGVPCPVLPEQDKYEVPEYILELLGSPAECRVLNYTDSLSSVSLRELMDRRNANRMLDNADVPMGLSQTSHFDDDVNVTFGEYDDDGAFGYVMNQDGIPKPGDQASTKEILSSAFYDAVEAIHNSNSKGKYEQELLAVFHELQMRANADCDANKKRAGKRISMFPPNSKRKKTHGTKHMNSR